MFIPTIEAVSPEYKWAADLIHRIGLALDEVNINLHTKYIDRIEMSYETYRNLMPLRFALGAPFFYYHDWPLNFSKKHSNFI